MRLHLAGPVLETVLQSLILAQVPLRFPRVRVWRSAVVKAKTVRGFVRSLPDGWADITGVIAPHGRALFIEVKSDTGRSSPDQVAFGDWVRALGAVHVVARSLEDVVAVLSKEAP